MPALKGGPCPHLSLPGLASLLLCPGHMDGAVLLLSVTVAHFRWARGSGLWGDQPRQNRCPGPSGSRLSLLCHWFLPQSPCTASFVFWGFRPRKEGTLEGAAGLSPLSLPNSDCFTFGRIFMISALLLSFFLNITLLAFPQALPDTWKQSFVFTITCFIVGERWEDVRSLSGPCAGLGSRSRGSHSCLESAQAPRRQQTVHDNKEAGQRC